MGPRFICSHLKSFRCPRLSEGESDGSCNDRQVDYIGVSKKQGGSTCRSRAKQRVEYIKIEFIENKKEKKNGRVKFELNWTSHGVDR